MKVFTSVLTCSSRWHEALETGRQASAIGLEPAYIEESCTPARTENVLRGAMRAMLRARSAGQGLLFLEDDVDLAPTFPKFLQDAIDGEVLTTFIVFRESLYPDSVNVEGDLRRGKARADIVRLDDRRVEARRGFHGSQALYLPPAALRLALSEPDNFTKSDGSALDPLEAPAKRHGFDFWVKANARVLGGLWAAYPNPVQHRTNEPSTFGGSRRFTSRTYDLEADWG